jgi:hypothetical protein
VIALGRLGWPLRRIEQETGVRRETAGAYLKAAGIGCGPRGSFLEGKKYRLVWHYRTAEPEFVEWLANELVSRAVRALPYI